MSTQHLYKIIFMSVLVCFLTACPRIANIDLFNNTGVDLQLYFNDQKQSLKPGESTKIKFTGSDIQISSELGLWNYSREIPHNGEDGPYFDGTLKLQVNTDGKVYALKVGESAPVQMFSEQPSGYPLNIE